MIRALRSLASGSLGTTGLTAVLFFSLLGPGAGSASAQNDCRSIADAAQRLACYDKQFGVAPAPATAAPKAPAPAAAPAAAERRYWVSVEGSAFFSSTGNANLGIVSGGPSTTFTTTAAKIPTSPGFIGLFTVQSIPGDPINGTLLRGPNSSVQPAETLRLGFWRDADHSKGWDFEATHSSGSAATVVGPSGSTLGVPNANLFGTAGSFTISGPTTNAVTLVFVNTTPAVFVHLFNQVVSNTTTGTLDVNDSNRFYTVEANHWSRIAGRGGKSELYLLLGGRYASLSDRLRIATATSSSQITQVTYDPALGLPGNPNFNNVVNRVASTLDLLRANNHFFGPQVGLAGDYHWNRWWVDGDAKVALGANLSGLDLGGLTLAQTLVSTTPTKGIALAGIPLTVASGAPPVVTITQGTTSGGIFAQPVNGGTHSRPVFAMMPTVSGRFGYDFTSRLSGFVGYRFYLISDVTTVSGAASAPATVLFGERGYWAHSTSVGFRYQF